MAKDTFLLLHRPASNAEFVCYAKPGGAPVTALTVEVRELIAWDLDEYAFRDAPEALNKEHRREKIKRARLRLARREPHTVTPALMEEQTQHTKPLLESTALRPEFHQEYHGLDWRLGIVDLHDLLAFQRRLVFDPTRPTATIPPHDDWTELMRLAFGSKRSTAHFATQDRDLQGHFELRLRSGNPDLQVQFASNSLCSNSLTFALRGGSPNIEVAEWKGRWFLRDGYHRAYRLLQQGIHCVPAVVIHARTIEELGAAKPWFFSESQLFSDRPPYVLDFLQDEMTLSYTRTALYKFIRIRIEESLVPLDKINALEGQEL